MFQRMVTGALTAGGAAGLIAALLHFAFVQEVILLGERYESGELTHFADAGTVATTAEAEAGHSHDHADADAATDGHYHEHGDSAAPSSLMRNTLTVAFTVLIYVAYALVLFAGFGLAEQRGHKVGPLQGLLWGLGGFVSFQLAPAMGLPPELPGTIAAELAARQVWWWMTVILTATGLGLLGYGRQLWMIVLAGVLLALPHVIGAPQPDGHFGVAPSDVGATFAARVLGVGMIVWATLGWIGGQVWSRDRRG